MQYGAASVAGCLTTTVAGAGEKGEWWRKTSNTS